MLKWINICKVLELGKKARVDLFLLAQSGPVGRTIANYILWTFAPIGPSSPPMRASAIMYILKWGSVDIL